VIRRELALIEFDGDAAWTEDDASDWWDAHVPRPLSLTSSSGPLSPKSNVA
jgi:hypothetical protein